MKVKNGFESTINSDYEEILNKIVEIKNENEIFELEKRIKRLEMLIEKEEQINRNEDGLMKRLSSDSEKIEKILNNEKARIEIKNISSITGVTAGSIAVAVGVIAGMSSIITPVIASIAGITALSGSVIETIIKSNSINESQKIKKQLLDGKMAD